MKKTSKILVAIVSLLLIISIAVSCNIGNPVNPGNDTKSNDTSGETTNQKPADDPNVYKLPDADLEGYELRIFSIMGPVTTWLTFPYFSTEDTGSKISQSVHNRNLSIEDKLRCKITEENADSTNSELWISLLAGEEDEYQAGVDYSWSSLSRAVLNYLVDFKNIESINLDKPWWDSNLNETFSVNGHYFISSGSAMISSWDEVFVLYFNSKVASDINRDINLYNEVKNGTWTFDRMCQLIADADNNLNNPGSENETYGLATQAFYGVPSFMGTNDATYGVINSEGKIENSSTLERFITTAQNLAEKLPASDSVYYGDSEINQMFANEEAFFLHECIGAMTNMRNIDSFDYGILPMPKYTESSPYRSYSGAQYLLFIPYTNGNVEKTGTILEAMMGLSDSGLKQVYVEEMLGVIYSRTPEAAEMLFDYILPNTFYDIGGRQGLQFNTLIPIDRAIPLGMTDIKSMVDPVVDNIQAKIDDINNYNG